MEEDRSFRTYAPVFEIRVVSLRVHGKSYDILSFQ